MTKSLESDRLSNCEIIISTRIKSLACRYALTLLDTICLLSDGNFEVENAIVTKSESLNRDANRLITRFAAFMANRLIRVSYMCLQELILDPPMTNQILAEFEMAS